MIKNKENLIFNLSWMLGVLILTYLIWGRQDFGMMMPVFAITIFNFFNFHILEKKVPKVEDKKVETPTLSNFKNLHDTLGGCISELKHRDESKLVVLVNELERFYAIKEKDITESSTEYVFYRHAITEIETSLALLKNGSITQEFSKEEGILLTKLNFLADMYKVDGYNSKVLLDLDIITVIIEWTTLIRTYMTPTTHSLEG